MSKGHDRLEKEPKRAAKMIKGVGTPSLRNMTKVKRQLLYAVTVKKAKSIVRKELKVKWIYCNAFVRV